MINRLKNVIIIVFCVAYFLTPLADAIAGDNILDICTAVKEEIGQIEYQSLVPTSPCDNIRSQNPKASPGTEDRGFCFVCSSMVGNANIATLNVILKEASFDLIVPPLVLLEQSLFIFRPPKFL